MKAIDKILQHEIIIFITKSIEYVGLSKAMKRYGIKKRKEIK